MKKLCLFIACLCMAFAGRVHAVSLSFGDARFVGIINPGIPSDPVSTAGYVNTLTGLAPGTGPVTIGTEIYTRTNTVFASFPTVFGTDGNYLKQDNSNTTFDLGTGYSFLTAKYDANNAGTGVWDVRGITGVVDLPGTWANGQYGLSHTTAFGPTRGNAPGVPDGGRTAALFACALGVLGVFRRLSFV